MWKKACFARAMSLGIACTLVFCGCSGKYGKEKGQEVLTEEAHGQQDGDAGEDTKERVMAEKAKEKAAPELIQKELDRLGYGNCDISDWEGRLNTNNNNRALTGFWIESSLTISPKEQTEVMARIFGEGSAYSEASREELKKVMLVEEETEVPIYGKTGMGKTEGIVVDAWFTGFSKKEEENIYFCVYLGRTDGGNVSSAAAKEIAIRLVSGYFS